MYTNASSRSFREGVDPLFESNNFLKDDQLAGKFGVLTNRVKQTVNIAQGQIRKSLAQEVRQKRNISELRSKG